MFESCPESRTESLNGLQFLTAPMETDRFLLDYWGRRSLPIDRLSPHYFAGLPDLEALEGILMAEGAAAGFRLVDAGRHLAVEDFLRPSQGGNGLHRVPDIGRILEVYRRGATVVLQKVQKAGTVCPKLSALCAALRSTLHRRVEANVYLTPEQSQGFPVHFDSHDVFVLQTAGFKRWRLYESDVLPLDYWRQRDSAPRPGPLLCEVDLHAGDTLYIPRGVFHEALTVQAESAHVTVGAFFYTWGDVTSAFLTGKTTDAPVQLFHSARGDAGPIPFDRPAARQRRESLLQAVSTHYGRPTAQALEGLFREFQAPVDLHAEEPVRAAVCNLPRFRDLMEG